MNFKKNNKKWKLSWLDALASNGIALFQIGNATPFNQVNASMKTAASSLKPMTRRITLYGKPYGQQGWYRLAGKNSGKLDADAYEIKAFCPDYSWTSLKSNCFLNEKRRDRVDNFFPRLPVASASLNIRYRQINLAAGTRRRRQLIFADNEAYATGPSTMVFKCNYVERSHESKLRRRVFVKAHLALQQKGCHF